MKQEATDPPLAVRASGLVKRYGDVAAVSGLDLDIPAGQFFGLLGPNGSGKTSTIHMLATLIRPSGGSARVAGHDVVDNAVKVRGAIGLVFQESALDRTLTVAENLRFAGLLYNLTPAVIRERSAELLELFGLADKSNRPVGSLSGGMRRALDIVRGMIHHPRILFLDEPTIGLDLPNRRNIWRFIERLRARTGMTVLLTTHYLEEADRLCRCDLILGQENGSRAHDAASNVSPSRNRRHSFQRLAVLGTEKSRRFACSSRTDAGCRKYADRSNEGGTLARRPAEAHELWQRRKPILCFHEDVHGFQGGAQVLDGPGMVQTVLQLLQDAEALSQ